MTTGNWIQRDDLREQWIILRVGGEEKNNSPDDTPKLEYWETGVANANKLIRTNAQQVGHGNISTETELLDELLSELAEHRYQNAILLTLRETTLEKLRCRISLSPVSINSLRGFAHICIETQLNRYFGQPLAERGLEYQSLSPPRISHSGNGDEEAVKSRSIGDVWEQWQQLYRLIPATELEGEKL